MATDRIGMAKDALMQRMGIGRQIAEQKIREDPITYAIVEVAARLIADLSERK